MRNTLSYCILCVVFIVTTLLWVGRNGLVGIVTARFGHRISWGEIFRTRPDRPWGPPNLLYSWCRVLFPEGKAPSCPVPGWPLPSPFAVLWRGGRKVKRWKEFRPCACYEGVWVNRGVVHLILNPALLGEWSAPHLAPLYPFPLHRLCGLPEHCMVLHSGWQSAGPRFRIWSRNT